MMKNDNIQSNHRGSSPPFQDPERDFYDWMKKLNSIGQRDEMAPEYQRAWQPGNERPQPANMGDDGTRQGKDDESRWQDNRGMGGEAV